MKKFKRRGSDIVSHLSTYEVELLGSLISQLIEMVGVGEPEESVEEAESSDPLEALSRELEEPPLPPEAAQDPVLRRLFPEAYPDDAAAAADFRRFTERDLRAKKTSEAQQVLDRLVATEQGAYEVRIPPEEVDIWLRTLTSVRLAVATRLGITDAAAADELTELPDGDPRAFMANIYDWLGFAEETLINAI